MIKTSIFVSTDTTSLSVGSEEIYSALQTYLNQADFSHELHRVGSRGLYWLEPMLEIEHNGARHCFANLESEDVPHLFQADGSPNHSFAKYQGLTEEIPQFQFQQRFTMSRVGIVDPFSFEDYQNKGGLQGIRKALDLNPQAIVENIIASGLRGRGGAGFPTGIKMQTVAQAKAEQKYIVCNADEGDSGTFADRMILESDPFLLIEGMLISAIGVGANQGYIYLRSEYPYAKQVISHALQIAREKGLLGKNVLGSAYSFDIDLRIGAGAYICGEETSLLESIEGKRPLIRPKPPLPALSGLFGKPTVINNLLTLACLPDILAKGAEAYQSMGVGRSRGTITVQLAGNIRCAGLYEVPFGFSLKKLLYEIGGGTKSTKPIKCVQAGGPLGAFIPESQLDIPLTYEAFAENDAMLGHGGIVVFDESANMAKLAKYSMEFCARESCGKCTPCRIGTTRGKETIEKMLQNVHYEKNRDLLLDLCQTLREGSLCALGGLIPLPVESALRHFEADFLNP